jgi:hypothetical protein
MVIVAVFDFTLEEVHSVFGIWELVSGDAVHSPFVPSCIEVGGLQGTVDGLGGLFDGTQVMGKVLGRGVCSSSEDQVARNVFADGGDGDVIWHLGCMQCSVDRHSYLCLHAFG